MTTSPTTEDLQMVIMELDVLYDELSQNENDVTNTKPEKNVFASPSGQPSGERNFSFEPDEEDYDIPRPAKGVFNSEDVIPVRDTLLQHIEPQKDTTKIPTPNARSNTNYDDDNGDYSVLPSPKACSPASSTKSKRSITGDIYALPVRRTDNRNSLPPPPPPPQPRKPSSSSDADYDEVASNHSGDEQVPDYPHPQSSRSTASSIPTVQPVRRYAQSTHEDPDYDEVCSNKSLTINTDVRVVSKPRSPAEKQPIVVHDATVKPPEPAVTKKTPRVPSTRHARGGIEDDATQIIFVNCNLDEQRPDSTISSDLSEAHGNSREVLHLSGSGLSSASSDMTDSEGRKSNGSGCSCGRYMVPFMTFAVILCVAMLLFAAIAYVYIGLQLNKLSISDTGDADDVPASGNG